MTTSRGASGWIGTDSSDLDEYLAAFSEHGYPVQRVAHPRCASCDCTAFRFRVDDAEGCAERTCAACNATTLMLDSADCVDDADLETAQCPCGGEIFNVAVGFALYEDGDPRWVYLGLRCVEDGLLGVYADWKIDYRPSAHLLGPSDDPSVPT